MESDETTEYAVSEHLLRLAASGDMSDFGRLLESYRERLTRIVDLRMDRRLRTRLDAKDVVQDAFVEATERFDDFSNQNKMSFFLWLRFITVQKLLQMHRHHLGAQLRDARRDISIFNVPAPQATSAVLAAKLLGDFTSPTQNLHREEEHRRLRQALEEMKEKDREILVLRHFEQLTMKEAALLMDISESGASSRYFRALEKLRTVVEGPETQ